MCYVLYAKHMQIALARAMGAYVVDIPRFTIQKPQAKIKARAVASPPCAGLTIANNTDAVYAAIKEGGS